jgi:hypothetical protein
MGKQAKNRNRPMPVVLSLVSGALAVVVTMFVLKAVVSATDAGRLGGAAEYLAEYSESPAVFWLVTGIVVFFAMVAGGACADDLVLNAKFCEPCQLHMDSVKLHAVTLGGLRLLVAAIKQGSVRPAIGVYQSHRGKDGTTALFTCPNCGRGVLDISVAFNGKYKDPQGAEQTVQETWIVGSAKLGPIDVKRLLPFVEG